MHLSKEQPESYSAYQRNHASSSCHACISGCVSYSSAGRRASMPACGVFWRIISSPVATWVCTGISPEGVATMSRKGTNLRLFCTTLILFQAHRLRCASNQHTEAARIEAQRFKHLYVLLHQARLICERPLLLLFDGLGVLAMDFYK